MKVYSWISLLIQDLCCLNQLKIFSMQLSSDAGVPLYETYHIIYSPLTDPPTCIYFLLKN